MQRVVELRKGTMPFENYQLEALEAHQATRLNNMSVTGHFLHFDFIIIQGTVPEVYEGHAKIESAWKCGRVNYDHTKHENNRPSIWYLLEHPI